MLEKQSEIGRDAQLAMLMWHKWQAEIERAVVKVKLGVIVDRKRTKMDKWFRRQWYRSMMRDRRKKAQNSKVPVKLAQRGLQHSWWWIKTIKNRGLRHCELPDQFARPYPFGRYTIAPSGWLAARR